MKKKILALLTVIGLTVATVSPASAWYRGGWGGGYYGGYGGWGYGGYGAALGIGAGAALLGGIIGGAIAGGGGYYGGAGGSDVSGRGIGGAGGSGFIKVTGFTSSVINRLNASTTVIGGSTYGNGYIEIWKNDALLTTLSYTGSSQTYTLS